MIDPGLRQPEITTLSEGQENIFEGQWPERILPQVNRAELHSFYTDGAWAQALVFAGGGYTKLVYDKEGTEVASWLNGLGIDAHILIHRLPGADAGNGTPHPADIALGDAMAALDFLYTTEKTLPLFHVGLSSGGHLAGVMTCQQHELMARGALIAYAPLNANHRDHKYPAGKPDYPPVQKQDFYDKWPVGIADYPHAMPKVPVFVAYALHDRTVPVQHALRLIESASANELDVDAHIFSDAPHGFALRDTHGTHAAWPDLAADWLRRKALS